MRGTGAHNKNPYDAAVLDLMSELHATAKGCQEAGKREEAIIQYENMLKTLDKYHAQLSNSCYWRLLGVVWHVCHQFGPIDLWRARFLVNRPARSEIMRDPERLALMRLPTIVTATQLIEPGTDNQPDVFAFNLGIVTTPDGWVKRVYEIDKKHVVAYFNRGKDQSPHIVVPTLGAARACGTVLAGAIEL